MADTLETVSGKVVDRVSTFLRRALVQCHADHLLVLAFYRSAHGEEQILSLPLSPESDPAELAKEVTLAISEQEEATRFKLSALQREAEVTSLVLPAKGKGAAATKADLLNGDARDTLLTASIRGYQDLVRLHVSSTETREALLVRTIERLTERNGELEDQALDVAKRYIDLARQDREGQIAARVADVQIKALEGTADQIKRSIPILTAGVAKWAGVDAIGPAVEVLRALTAEQIQGISPFLDAKQKAALVKAWEAATKQKAELDKPKGEGG